MSVYQIWKIVWKERKKYNMSIQSLQMQPLFCFKKIYLKYLSECIKMYLKKRRFKIKMLFFFNLNIISYCTLCR